MQPTRKRAEDHPRPPIQARATSHCIGEDAMPIGEQLRELTKELFTTRALSQELCEANAEDEKLAAGLCAKLNEVNKRIACRNLDIESADNQISLIQQQKEEICSRAGSPQFRRPTQAPTDASNAKSPEVNMKMFEAKEAQVLFANSPMSKAYKQNIGSNLRKQHLKGLGDVPASPGPQDRKPIRRDVSPAKLALRTAREAVRQAKARASSPRRVAQIAVATTSIVDSEVEKLQKITGTGADRD